jgi:hypothetical protein
MAEIKDLQLTNDIERGSAKIEHSPAGIAHIETSPAQQVSSLSPVQSVVPSHTPAETHVSTETKKESTDFINGSVEDARTWGGLLDSKKNGEELPA